MKRSTVLILVIIVCLIVGGVVGMQIGKKKAMKKLAADANGDNGEAAATEDPES